MPWVMVFEAGSLPSPVAPRAHPAGPDFTMLSRSATRAHVLRRMTVLSKTRQAGKRSFHICSAQQSARLLHKDGRVYDRWMHRQLGRKLRPATRLVPVARSTTRNEAASHSSSDRRSDRSCIPVVFYPLEVPGQQTRSCPAPARIAAIGREAQQPVLACALPPDRRQTFLSAPTTFRARFDRFETASFLTVCLAALAASSITW